MVISSEPRVEPRNGTEKHVSINDTLQITDNRTGNQYTLPIVRNSINAMDFKQMKAPRDVDNSCDQTEYGIRVYDPGFGNTAVSESSITYKLVSLLSIDIIPDIYTAMVAKESSVIVAMTLATWSPTRTLPIHNFCCSKVTYQPHKRNHNGSWIWPRSLSLIRVSLMSFALFRK